jgi:hypothetical protein
MTMLVLATAVLLALFVTLILHAIRGRGTKVAGVPKPLWVLALVTFDPLIFGAYLVFVVRGVARGASWRKWVVYAACAFVVAVRFLPLVVPSSGSVPTERARPFALIPAEMKLAVDFGSAHSSVGTSRMWGAGWVVRDALVVGDGHPVSAAVVDQIARSLEAAGVPEVRFVQSADELPAAPADLVVSVSVHDVFALDLVAASYWSGRVQVGTGWRPFSEDTWASEYDRFVDTGGASLEGSWNVASTRFGPVWGTACYDHVVTHLGDVGARIAQQLGDPYHGGRIAPRAAAAQGSWREPELAALLAPYQPQALLRGAGLLRDAQATWKVAFGDDPAAAVQALAAGLRQAGWDEVQATDANRWWQLTAERDVDGRHQYVRVRPSRDRELEFGPEAPLPTTYVVAYHERLGGPRLRELAASLLDSGDDDYLLRLLGPHVPEARYREWRTQVLGGDAGVANLLNVARLDRERGESPAGAALLPVAAWLVDAAGSGAGDRSSMREQVGSAAAAIDLELPRVSEPPDADAFARAGLPLLDGQWRRLPYLPVVDHREVAAQGAQQVRRFVAIGRDGVPVVLQVQLVAQGSGDLQVDVGIAGGARSVEPVAHLDRGVAVRGSDGRFEVRRLDGHVEVRWLTEDD